MSRTASVFGFAVLIPGIVTVTAYAGEIGHYAPGVANVRDLAVPEPGFYGIVYNFGYLTDRLNDADGNQISSLTIGNGPGQSVTLDLDVDVSTYALAPGFIWVAAKRVLKGKYGFYIAPTFTNTSINALLSSATNAGRSASAGQFNVGDIFVQPVWLGWTGNHYDISYGYGFYIPAGKYETTTVSLPIVGPVTVEGADNTGFGFWTNQNQGAVYLYPWADKRMAVQNALTWEIHRKKRNFDLTPGQNLTWNWGVSQYLPLKKDKSVLLEVGPAGYSSFQVSDDSGADARNPAVHDSVHAAGVQVGVTAVERVIALNFRWLNEFSATDRFEGSSIGFNFAARF